MSKSEEFKKMVNSKSTKLDIKIAFDEAVRAIQEMEDVFNPSKIAKENEDAKVIEASEQVVETPVSKFDLKKYLNEIIIEFEQRQSEVDAELMSATEEYLKLKAGIEIKKQEIKDIYGVDVQLGDLSKLIQLYSDKEVELKNKFSSFENEVYTKEKNLKQQYEDAQKSLKTSYTRQVEEDEYNHKRNKLKLENELADIRENEVKYIKQQKDHLDELKAKWADDFKELENLKEAVDSIPSQLEEAKNEGYQEGLTQSKKSYGFEVALLKKDYDGKITLLESQVDTLTANLASMTSEKNKLNEKLETAYSEMKDLASGWSKQEEQQNYINQLETVTTNLSNKKDTK